MILGNEYLRRRLGRHIHRKPSHFGLWLDEGNDNHDDNPCSHDNHNDNHNDNHCSNNNSYYSHGSQVQLNLTDTNQVDINQVNTKPKQRKPTTAIATFKVEGELGSAKVLFFFFSFSFNSLLSYPNFCFIITF